MHVAIFKKGTEQQHDAVHMHAWQDSARGALVEAHSLLSRLRNCHRTMNIMRTLRSSSTTPLLAVNQHHKLWSRKS
jgi:hypothetical protein